MAYLLLMFPFLLSLVVRADTTSTTTETLTSMISASQTMTSIESTEDITTEITQANTTFTDPTSPAASVSDTITMEPTSTSTIKTTDTSTVDTSTSIPSINGENTTISTEMASTTSYALTTTVPQTTSTTSTTQGSSRTTTPFLHTSSSASMSTSSPLSSTSSSSTSSTPSSHMPSTSEKRTSMSTSTYVPTSTYLPTSSLSEQTVSGTSTEKTSTGMTLNAFQDKIKDLNEQISELEKQQLYLFIGVVALASVLVLVLLIITIVCIKKRKKSRSPFEEFEIDVGSPFMTREPVRHDDLFRPRCATVGNNDSGDNMRLETFSREEENKQRLSMLQMIKEGLSSPDRYTVLIETHGSETHNEELNRNSTEKPKDIKHSNDGEIVIRNKDNKDVSSGDLKAGQETGSRKSGIKEASGVISSVKDYQGVTGGLPPFPPKRASVNDAPKHSEEVSSNLPPLPTKGAHDTLKDSKEITENLSPQPTKVGEDSPTGSEEITDNLPPQPTSGDAETPKDSNGVINNLPPPPPEITDPGNLTEETSDSQDKLQTDAFKIDTIETKSS